MLVHVECRIVGSVKVPIKSVLSSCKRLIRLIGRPSRDEVWVYIKVGLMGIGIIGIIGFVVKFVSTMLQAMLPSG